MRGFRLRKCDFRNDIPLIYKMMNGNDQYLFSTKLSFNSISTFSEWFIERLHHSFHDFFIIELSDGKAIGYIHNYDFSLINGHCKIVEYLNEESRHGGIGAAVAIQYMNYLFKKYPLNKIFTTVYNYNAESIMSNSKAGFINEGMIKEFRYHDGKYHDLQIFSISRTAFFKTLGSGFTNDMY